VQFRRDDRSTPVGTRDVPQRRQLVRGAASVASREALVARDSLDTLADQIQMAINALKEPEYPLRSDRNRPSGMYLHVTGNCRCARGSNRRGFAACHPETQSGLSVRPIKAPKPTTSRELDRAGSSARHLSRASAPAPRQPAGLLRQSRLIPRSLRGQAPRSSSRAIYRAPRPMSASVRRTQCSAATRRNAHITRTAAYPRVVNCDEALRHGRKVGLATR
jgi:hypothetical protein